MAAPRSGQDASPFPPFSMPDSMEFRALLAQRYSWYEECPRFAGDSDAPLVRQGPNSQWWLQEGELIFQQLNRISPLSGAQTGSPQSLSSTSSREPSAKIRQPSHSSQPASPAPAGESSAGAMHLRLPGFPDSCLNSIQVECSAISIRFPNGRKAPPQGRNLVPVHFRRYESALASVSDGFSAAEFSFSEVPPSPNSPPASSSPSSLNSAPSLNSPSSASDSMPRPASPVALADTGEAREIRMFTSAVYRDLYPGVDLELPGRLDGLRMEFRAAPGADWRNIEVQWSGSDRMEFLPGGRLRIWSGGRALPAQELVIYQEGAFWNPPRILRGGFSLRGADRYGFQLADGYDPSQPLIFAVEAPGAEALSGSSCEWMTPPARGQDEGDIFAGAYWSLPPPQPSGLDRAEGSPTMLFWAKQNPEGGVLWWTELSGRWGAMLSSLVPDEEGYCAAAGAAWRGGWPMPAAPDADAEESAPRAAPSPDLEALAARVSPEGKLLWVALFGGAGDDAALHAAMDADGNLRVAGVTASPDFPRMNADIFDGLENAQYTPPRDRAMLPAAFIACFSPQGALTWSLLAGPHSADWRQFLEITPEESNILQYIRQSVTFSQDTETSPGIERGP